MRCRTARTRWRATRYSSNGTSLPSSEQEEVSWQRCGRWGSGPPSIDPSSASTITWIGCSRARSPQIPKYFPTPDIRNPAILVERGLRVPGRSPAVIAVNAISEGAIAGASGQRSQVLPRYTYDERPDALQELLAPLEAPGPHDNITDEALGAYRTHYGDWVTKNHIFSYVYGILHSAGLPPALRRRSRQAIAAHPRSRNGGCLPRVL